MLPLTLTPRNPAPVSDLERADREFNAGTNRCEYESIWDMGTILEQRAAESAALDSLERGYLPRDLASRVSRTSLVGHA